MYAYKDILELAGLTTRLYVLLSSLHNLPSLPMSSSADSDTPQIVLDNVDVSIPASGTHEAPLVKALSFTLRAGDHLMITGSNGVGKTAVARVLSGLWAPGNAGTVHRPGRGDVFVVPQRAYMVTGSLLDQYVSHASKPSPYIVADRQGHIKDNLSTRIHTVRTVGAKQGGADGNS